MKKTIIFSILSLLILNISFAVTIDDIKPNLVIRLDMADNCTLDSSSSSAVPTLVGDPAWYNSSMATNLNGHCNFDGSDALKFAWDPAYRNSDRDYTIAGWFAWEGSSSTNHHLFATKELSDNWVFVAPVRNSASDKAWFSVNNGSTPDSVSSSSAYTTGVHYLVVAQNATHLRMWIDGVEQSSISTTKDGFSQQTNLCFGARCQDTPDRFFQGNLTQLLFSNVSWGQDEVDLMYNSGNGRNLMLDSGSPAISDINCTSCNIPDGDITPPYETSDTTPTFSLSTNMSADCRIGDENLSYSSMESSRDCQSGEGTTEHTCTLTTQDELKYSTDYVYIACANINNESLANTIELLMNITDLEINATQAIEDGIYGSAIWPGATIYSDQQVYLRDLENNQKLAEVDTVAVYGNQRWIFNYGNTSLGLFNITPVVYVLDMVNTPLSTIEGKVSLFINSTKN